MLDGLQDRISKLEALKNQAVSARSALMIQVEAKESYIEEIDARLDELNWVKKELAEPKVR